MGGCYSELIEIESFEDRIRYLQEYGRGHDSPRDSSMNFYKSRTWEKLRKDIILRDDGFDLGVFNVDIYDRVIVHHINPLTIDDIENLTDKVLDPENLITTSNKTHNIIHYGYEPEATWQPRTPGDTTPWRKEETDGRT